jgi:hypothetical protein
MVAKVSKIKVNLSHISFKSVSCFTVTRREKTYIHRLNCGYCTVDTTVAGRYKPISYRIFILILSLNLLSPHDVSWEKKKPKKVRTRTISSQNRGPKIRSHFLEHWVMECVPNVIVGNLVVGTTKCEDVDVRRLATADALEAKHLIVAIGR